MRNSIIALTTIWVGVLLGTLVVSSCQKVYKNLEDYFPKVQMVSVSVEEDGTVSLKGALLSEGASSVEYLGFSCGTDSLHVLSSRQQFGELDEEGFFYASYEGFDPDSTYYFRTWATNSFGYVRGDAVPVQGIIAESVSPPCTPSLNTVSLGAGVPTAEYSAVQGEPFILNTWRVNGVTYDGPMVTFTFGSALTTKVYTVVDYNSPGPGEVFVYFSYNSISGSLSSGHSVYVLRSSPNNFEITVCNAPWAFGGGTYFFNTRFLLTL